MLSRHFKSGTLKVAERRIVELEAELSAIAGSQALIEFDPDGIVLFANDNFLKLMGYERHEVVGRHHRIFMTAIEAASPDYRTFWAELAQGQSRSAEFRRLAKGGREVWLQGSYNPVLSPDGRCTKILKIAVDVTEAKQQAADFAGQIAAIDKSQAVIAFALDGTIIEANDCFLGVVGYERDEVIGRHHRMFVEDREANAASYRGFWDTLREGHYSAGEFKRITKDGREIWLQAIYNPISGPDGRLSKVVKFATEITAAKMRSADFAGQIDAIGRSQAVIEFDLHGTILNANANFLAAMGYEHDEVVGRHHSIFVTTADRKSKDYEEFWRRLRSGEFFSREFMRVGKGGRTVWIQASYNPILDLNGRPFKIVKYATDITRQVQEREKFNLLSLVADETDNSVVITDKDQKVVYVNRGFERLTGYTAAEVLGQVPGRLLQGPMTDRATIARIRERLASGEPFYEEILNYGKAGKPYWISLAINPVRGRSGYVEQFISIQANVTETKQRAMEFNVKLDAIGAANIIAEWTLDGSPLAVNRSGSAGAFETGLRSIIDEGGYADIIRGETLRRELTWKGQGSEPLWLDAFFTVLKDLEGNPQRILMCGVDITSKKVETDRSTKAMADMMSRITGIVDALSGFARETNLLALNAGIEAARAQDTGRGFAIIAQEIRKLAGKAGTSVDEINQLLAEGHAQIDRLAREQPATPGSSSSAPARTTTEGRRPDTAMAAVVPIAKVRAA